MEQQIVDGFSREIDGAPPVRFEIDALTAVQLVAACKKAGQSEMPSSAFRCSSFPKGTPVPWKPSPMGIAQIEEVRRTRARLCYPCKNGRLRFPVVPLEKLQSLIDRTPLVPGLHNPFRRSKGMR